MYFISFCCKVRFYSDLLETKLSDSHPTNFGENFNTFVENLVIPKLSVEQSMALEVELTLDEIKEVLKSFQNNKSPGEDGFSKEFYEKFFDLIGMHLLVVHLSQLHLSERMISK